MAIASAQPTLTSGTDVYVPVMATIAGVRQVGPQEMVFEVELPERVTLGHRPGQFVAVSVFGVGEAPISVSSPPGKDSTFELCVRAAGNVTKALHSMRQGAFVGIRGPFGRGFPIDAMKGQDLLMVVGGLGMAPLRSLLLYTLSHRNFFDRLILLSGSRTPQDTLFADELLQIAGREDIVVQTTVDAAPEGYYGNVGPVTNLVRRARLDPNHTVAVSVGPPLMYRFVLRELVDKSIPNDRMYFSLERHMKCSIGKCGHCQMGPEFICQDGPVFRYADIRHIPEAI